MGVIWVHHGDNGAGDGVNVGAGADQQVAPGCCKIIKRGITILQLIYIFYIIFILCLNSRSIKCSCMNDLYMISITA